MLIRRAAWVLALGCTLAAGCTDEGPSVASDAAPDATPDVTYELPPYVDPYACAPAPTPLPLDEPLDGAQSRAGVMRADPELLGGEGAYGALGHFKLYNDRVRFVVQGATDPRGANGVGRPIGYDLYGGNLIDADRVRPRGERGQDLFRETFPLVGYRVSNVEEVAVACDGTGGHPAAVRVVGSDRATRLLGSLDAIARERFVRVVTHYVLRPGSDALEVRTVVESRQGRAFESVAAGDFMAFGSALAIFTDATGFGDAGRAGMQVPWIAGVSDPGEPGRRVSYAIAPATGGITVPIVDASGTVTLYGNLGAPAPGRAEFVRYLAVGTGDVASAVRPLLEVRRDPHGTVAGTTTPGALVYAYRGSYAPGAAARMVARAGADGAYRMPLPPGEYALVAVDEGRARGAPVAATVAAGAEARADPRAGATGTLVLDVAERQGDARARVPLKVSLQGLGVEAPDGDMGELEGEREAYGLHRVVFSRTGTERVAVKPGRYLAVVSRGDEYDTARVEVTVAADGEATLRADVRRVVDTRGYISGDFHQHTVGSVDSPRALCARVLENVAEGLEYAATTDHDNVTDFAPCVRDLALGSIFGAMAGNEISVVGVGHFNAYPLTVNPADPRALVGAQYWADLTAQQLFDRVRAEPGDPILHVSHPRSTGLKGYFTYLALDPLTGIGQRPLARGFEAIEVNESLGAPAEFLPSNDVALAAAARRDPARVAVLHDWFALLARGEHATALGNSDTHGRNNGSGYPRNHLRVDEDRPSRVTAADVREAIRAQRVLVSNGIVVRTRVGGAERMGWREVVPAAGGALDLEVEVQAAPWVTARELTVYENGRPLALTPDGRGGYDARPGMAPGDPLAVPLGAVDVVRMRATVRLHPARDSYYVVVARGGPLAPVGAGDAFGYTNPVYVDTDGNGWQPLVR